MTPPPAPNWRKPVAALAVLALIGGWALLVVQLAAPVTRLHWAAQALFYLVAGLAWIWLLPLRRLLAWSESRPKG